MATAAVRSAAFLLLLLISVLPSSTSLHIPGLDSFFSDQSRLDPLASNDSFSSLPSKLHSLLLHQIPHHRLSSLLSLSIPISLHIKLVGPSFSSPELLSSFLSSSHSSSPFSIISPSDSDPPLSHLLSISHSLNLDVSLSSSSLASSLSSTLASSISVSTSSLRSSLISLDFSVVDRLISDDFSKENPLHTFYIYLINLGPQSKPYAYSYGGAGDSSAAFTRCLGTIWTGKERYLWIDLAAGPVDYGPALSGDGVLPRGEFHPLATLHGSPKSDKAVMADLASLVYSAYQVLLTPSLRIPVSYESKLTVQFIHVYESEDGDKDFGLDWKMIEKTFADEAHVGGLLLRGQSLKFSKYDVKYKDCAMCSFAISRSISSYTSRFLFDNYTLIVSEYVDSKKLHQILSDSADEFKKLAGISLTVEEEQGRVLPIYVFDLDYNMLLLLDRYHQSVAFKDMVIAVRTKNSQTVSDYSCNGRHVFTQTRELERPLIGSILQSMWGVSPTHMVWSPRHNSTLVDYTWSVGQTPFGPFSEVSSLSFVQKDAARRNVILTWLNYTITNGVDVLESVKAHGGDGKFLRGNTRSKFMQRWILLQYKLEKVMSALSHSDFELATYFLRSSDHDLFAIQSLVYSTSQEIEASLVCFKDPPFPWASFSMSVATFFAVCYIYTKRDKFFRNKSKQF